jgi:hypothetical protein
MDLVRALFPAPARASSRGISKRDTFGSITVAAILTGLTAASGVASSGLKLAPQIKKMLSSQSQKLEDYQVEYKKAKLGLARARTKSARKRHLKRMIRYEELVEVTKLKQNLVKMGLAHPGPMLEGTALEMRRNMLADEWESSEPERRKHIERLIQSYDKELANIQRMVVEFQKLEQSRSSVESAPKEGSMAIGPPWAELIKSSDSEAVQRPRSTEAAYLQSRTLDASGVLDELKSHQNLQASILDSDNPLKVNQALVTGIGGLQFVAQAPMREVCIPLYPSRPADSYAGANGILVPGDDPILLMTLTAGQNTNFLASADFEISTELFDYGKYRVVGFMSHPQGNYQIRTAAGANRTTAQVNGVGITIRSIQAYNGEELLLPLGDMDVNSFGIFPQTDAYPGISSTSLSAFAQQAPYNQDRSERFFVGLRTNPVIEGTARLKAIVRCYVYATSNNLGLAPNGMLTGDTIEVPVSVSLLGQMLEDKVFGNPLVPGPASRPGAQVRLGLRELGTDSRGIQQLQLRNTRYTPPTLPESE